MYLNLDSSRLRSPGMINAGFHSSMLADINFHSAMADALDETGDTSLGSYHVIMTKVYQSFLAP